MTGWKVGGGVIPLDRPVIMGILNVTPDSFSDGGRFADVEAAVAAGVDLAARGAVIVDVGGESTRPGAEAVGVEAEIERVIPVVARLSAGGIRVSIDTMKPVVAEAAIEAGAIAINDVTGFAAVEMRRLAADAGVGVVAMHMKGEPRTMQDAPHYDDVVNEVIDLLTDRARRLTDAGCDPASIALDPGIGFGKTFHHNLELLDRLDELAMVGFPVVLGTSRKSFLGTITGRPAHDRDAATAVTVALGVARGAMIFRVHEPSGAAEAALIAWTILRGGDRPSNRPEPKRHETT